MPHVADLVYQTTDVVGTGPATLRSVTGYREFDDAIPGNSISDLFSYFIRHKLANEWERGLGYIDGSGRLVRETVQLSSNSNAAVSFSVGTKEVTNDVPASLQDKLYTLADDLASKTNSAQAAAAAPVQSVAGKVGAVTLAKADVGLGNVDNTSDANKPVSTAQSAAIQNKPESLIFAVSDEITALSLGNNKLTFRMPYAFVLTGIKASVSTAPTGSVLTVDVNENGSSILSTKITIDATEKTSVTAAAPPVISDPNLSSDSEITVDIDTVGSTIPGAGLKVTLLGHQ